MTLTFAEAYVRAYTGTGRMWRLSWARGNRLLAGHPVRTMAQTPLIEAEVMLPSTEGWVTLPYALTSEDLTATDWCSD